MFKEQRKKKKSEVRKFFWGRHQGFAPKPTLPEFGAQF